MTEPAQLTVRPLNASVVVSGTATAASAWALVLDLMSQVKISPERRDA